MKIYVLLIVVTIATFCNWNNTSNNLERFTWDFSEDENYSYKYEFDNYVTLYDSNGVDTSSFVSKLTKGDIIFESNSDNTADFIVRNNKISQIIKNAEYCDTINYNAPQTKVINVSVTGVVDDQIVTNSLKMMFPLPSSDIKEGETQKIDLDQSFMDLYTGELITTKGCIELTLETYVEYLGFNCALFRSNTNLNETVSAPYCVKNVEMYGIGLHYFDTVNNKYIASTYTLMTDVKYYPEFDYGDTKIKTTYGIIYSE